MQLKMFPAKFGCHVTVVVPRVMKCLHDATLNRASIVKPVALKPHDVSSYRVKPREIGLYTSFYIKWKRTNLLSDLS